MSARQLRIVTCVLLPCLLTGCGPSGERDPVADLKVPDQLILYSLDGRDIIQREEVPVTITSEIYFRYPVLGRLEIRDPARKQEIVARLKDGLAQPKGDMARCFMPRHGIRIV